MFAALLLCSPFLSGLEPQGDIGTRVEAWRSVHGETFLATCDNDRQFCGNCCPACYGQVHTDGEPWMGAAWKIRSNLKAEYGETSGRLIADTLFLGWMEAYNQLRIKEIIEIQWLTLDDNDGNLCSTPPTPHFDEIDTGFRDQGWPGYTCP